MVDIKKSKIFLGITLPILAFFLMSHNVFADQIRVQNRTARTVQFNYSNSTSGAQSATIQNGIQGPVIVRHVNASSLSPVYLQQINLNNNINMELDRTIVVPITIRVYGYNDVFANQAFDITSNFRCPIAEYTNMYVNYCNIKSVTTEHIQDGYAYTAVGSSATGTGEYLYEYYTEYVVDIVLKTRLEDPFTQNYIKFVDTPILQLVNNSTQADGKNIAWQIVFNDFVYLYEETDPAADAINEQAAKENAAVDNIDNQSTNDMGGSSNQQTTSIIGTISSFVGAFSNVQPSSNCNLTLPFPEFLGGDTVANICQGKEKAPALITIGSSLLLIVTFVPLAFVMLRMIYTEIRSFTNG